MRGSIRFRVPDNLTERDVRAAQRLAAEAGEDEVVRQREQRQRAERAEEATREAQRKAAASSSHSRAMDAKHSLAADLRRGGMDPQRAEQLAREATERANR